jgi:hypothetical protein
MSLRIAFFILLLGLHAALFAGGKQGRLSSTQSVVTTRVLDINRFNIQVTDRGNLFVDNGGPGGGVWWYRDAMNWNILFDQGPWIIGKMNGKPAMGATYWGTTYLPGPMINGRPALELHPEDSVRFHPYKISRASTSLEPDFVSWPGDLGAPTDPGGKPLLLGDQMVWSVFNGVDSTVVLSDWTKADHYPHMPVEIHQSLYAREGSRTDTSLLANCAFEEWTFINKGTAVIESCYIGLWTDIDLWAYWNPFGVDTANQTGYCRDDVDLDTTHTEPHAFGYTLLYGPRVPDPASNAIFCGQRIKGYRNLSMSSFWGIRNDWGSPQNPQYWPVGPNTIEEAWNIARGYDKSGQVIIDSVTKLPTRFPWSGDPLTATGWVYNGSTEGEGGLIFFTGPFTLAPGDTQWVMLALIPAAAYTTPEAVRTVRNNAARIRAMTYEEIAQPRALAVREEEKLPANFSLEQNWPNPFNPTTVVSSSVPAMPGRDLVSTGGRDGQYSVVSDVRIVIYDLLGREVATLANERRAPGIYHDTFDATGLASGVYFYRMTAGSFTQSRKMILMR